MNKQFRAGIEVFDEWYAADLIYEDGKVSGVAAYDIRNSEPAIFNAKVTMFATGGHGRALDLTQMHMQIRVIHFLS